ncbi:MAG: xylulokinase [Spirochaetia bacterium]
MKELVLGIDVGTSSCKTILIDAAGTVIDSARHEYGVRSSQYGWAEQDPEDWFRAFRRGLAEILERNPDAGRRVCAAGVTGQMIGLTILDREGSVVRPAIIWMDQRCLPQVEFLKKNFEAMIRRITLNPVNTAYTLPKILWLKENEPQSWKKLYKIQLPKDYVRLRLTGEWATDLNDAAGTLLVDVTNLRWADELIDALEFERDRLPSLVPSTAVAGHLTGESARELGLREGIPVIAGAGDLAAENLAAGILGPQQLLTRLGSAGSSSTSLEFPLPDPLMVSPCYPHCIEGRWLAEIADHTFGVCERWFRDTFFSLERETAEQEGTDYYALMDAMAEQVPAGSGGLIFHPFNGAGPYWNPLLRGAFYGVSIQHGKGHFFRAMLEGSAFCLKDSIEMLQQRIQIKPTEYRLVGGGTRSRLWTQIICDVLGMDAGILKTADAALGAAMLAAQGAGLFESAREAIEKCVVKQRQVLVDHERAATYETFHGCYKLLHARLMEDSRTLQDALDKTSRGD